MTTIQSTKPNLKTEPAAPTQENTPPIPASRSRRAGACLINAAINTTVGILIISSATSNINGPTPGTRIVAGIATIGLGALLYRLNVCSVAKRGGKLGHRICGLQLNSLQTAALPDDATRTANPSGDKVTLRRARTRAAAELLIALTLVGGLAVTVVDTCLILFTPDRRRIVDRIAGTILTQTATNPSKGHRR